jgi:hypothetical protein
VKGLFFFEVEEFLNRNKGGSLHPGADKLQSLDSFRKSGLEIDPFVPYMKNL